MTLEAPVYAAQNVVTEAFMVEHGEVVTGTYTWVATKVKCLISEPNRSAYVLVRQS